MRVLKQVLVSANRRNEYFPSGEKIKISKIYFVEADKPTLGVYQSMFGALFDHSKESKEFEEMKFFYKKYGS
jgi:hypothetical protein